jgi:tetratricopeptide (TPR) repeat protein
MAHGLFQDRISHAFKLPLLAEMLYAWPVALGLDQVARLLNLAAVAAACVGFLSILGGPSPAGWTALAALLSSFYLFFLMTAAKNDVVAFSFAAAGLLASDKASREGARGRGALRFAGWLLVGFAVATKYTYGAMAVAVAAWGPVRRRESWRLAARRSPGAWAIVVPLLPWYAKSWLMFGNPVYFWLTSVFPTVGWSPESMRTWTMRMVEPYAAPGALDWVGTVARVPWRFLSFAPALVLGAGIAFLPGAGGAWRVAALGGATAWVAIYFGRIERYATTADFVVALATGFALAGLGGHRRWKALRAGILALCLFPLADMVPHAVNRFPVRYLAGQYDEHAYLTARFGPLFETQDWIGRNLRPRRLLVDGEWRTYRFRCPIAGTLTMGHPPLVWEAVKRSSNPADVARRLRQEGISHIACNFITGVYQSSVNEAFRWDRRMLMVARDFTGYWLEVVKEPRTVDHSGGGFYVYRVLSGPARRMAPIFFLPGAMGALYEARECERLGLLKKSFDAMNRLMKTVPEVGQYRNITGYYWWLLGRHDTAYKFMLGPVRDGMIDDQNWYCFGVSAMALKRYDEAEVALKRAEELYPMRRRDIMGQLATNSFRWGAAAYSQGALEKACEMFGASYGYLVAGGMRGRGDYESAAAVLLLRAKALVMTGRRAEARADMDRALDVFPEAGKYEDFREVEDMLAGRRR